MEIENKNNKISIKHQLMDFYDQKILNIDLQHSNNYLVFSGDSRDISLVNMDLQNENGLNLTYEFLDKEKKNANILRWSPDDQYLAIACDTLIIYKIQDQKFQKCFEYVDHRLEIISFAWSPTSEKIVSASLDAKLIIRSLNSNNQQNLQCQAKVLSVIWDPLDKYIACLNVQNQVIIYNSITLDIVKVIPLQVTPEIQLINMREDRKIDWSPDCAFILAPSLDDKIIPVVCAIDRQDFQIQYTFTGPFSSINCGKILLSKLDSVPLFSQSIINNIQYLQWEILMEILVYLKLRQIWKIMIQKQSNYLNLINKDQISFKTQLGIMKFFYKLKGNLLLATTRKKYIFSAYFEINVFGKRLSAEELKDLKEEKYGNAKQSKKFQVYDSNNFQFLCKYKIQIEQQPQQQQQQQQKTIITKQSVEIKGGKKFIIPQMQKIIKTNNIINGDCKPNDQNTLDIETPILNIQKPQISDRIEQAQDIIRNEQKIPRKPLNLMPEICVIKLFDNKSLELEFIKTENQTKIKCFTNIHLQKQLIWTDLGFFYIQKQMDKCIWSNSINILQFIQQMSLYYILIITKEGIIQLKRRLESGLVMEDIVDICINENSYILILNGFQIKVFDIWKKEVIFNEKIPIEEVKRGFIDDQNQVFVVGDEKEVIMFKNGLWRLVTKIGGEWKDKELQEILKKEPTKFWIQRTPLQQLGNIQALEEKLQLAIQLQNPQLYVQLVKSYLNELSLIPNQYKLLHFLDDLFRNNRSPDYNFIQNHQLTNNLFQDTLNILFIHNHKDLIINLQHQQKYLT